MRTRDEAAAAALPVPLTRARLLSPSLACTLVSSAMGCGASSHAKGLALFSALDERLVKALASGAIKLLRADFLLAEEICGPKILRRAALEALELERGIQIFLTPEEAAMTILLHKRLVGVLSYMWSRYSAPAHPCVPCVDVQALPSCPVLAPLVPPLGCATCAHGS